jgi:hypothetical protein
MHRMVFLGNMQTMKMKIGNINSMVLTKHFRDISIARFLGKIVDQSNSQFVSWLDIQGRTSNDPVEAHQSLHEAGVDICIQGFTDCKREFQLTVFRLEGGLDVGKTMALSEEAETSEERKATIHHLLKIRLFLAMRLNFGSNTMVNERKHPSRTSGETKRIEGILQSDE